MFRLLLMLAGFQEYGDTFGFSGGCWMQSTIRSQASPFRNKGACFRQLWQNEYGNDACIWTSNRIKVVLKSEWEKNQKIICKCKIENKILKWSLTCRFCITGIWSTCWNIENTLYLSVQHAFLLKWNLSSFPVSKACRCGYLWFPREYLCFWLESPVSCLCILKR